MQNQDLLSSNLNLQNINKYIESNIENKINQLFEILPQANHIKIPKMIHEYTVYELYQGTIQTAIDILNDVVALSAQYNYMDQKVYRERLMNIFLLPERRIYIGIIFVFLSFIIYFIDGADA